MAWDIVYKIQQLVAKAEDKATTPEEADAVMRKVRKLLDQHGISLLTITDAMSNDPVDTSRSVYRFWKSSNWVRRLSDAAAAYYGVRVVWSTRGNAIEVSAVGRESCRAAFTLMLPYLVKAVRRQAARGVREKVYTTTSRAENQIGHAMTVRLQRLVWERRPEVPSGVKEAAGRNALIPVDEIEAAMQAAFPTLADLKLQSRTIITVDAVRRAAEISLEEQVAYAESPQRQIK